LSGLKRTDEWTIKGTRGSVLIEKGDLVAGISLLSEVFKHDPSAFDRAIAASFLALAELKQNDHSAAREWIRICRHLDPNCVSMHRIESLLTEPDATPTPAAN